MDVYDLCMGPKLNILQENITNKFRSVDTTDGERIGLNAAGSG